MPHDVNGKPLREGDEVVVRCRVQTVQTEDSSSSVTLQTAMADNAGGVSLITLSSRQVEKTGSTPLDTMLPAPPKSISA